MLGVWSVERGSSVVAGGSLLLATAAIAAFFMQKRGQTKDSKEKKVAGPEVPRLYYKPDSDLHQYIEAHCPLLKEPFLPAWWARGPHVQCLLPSLMSPAGEVEYIRELLDMDDGGVLALDWAVDKNETLTASSPILLILPSLTGDAAGFAGLSRQALDSGFRPVVLNKRGHGGAPLRTPRMTSYGDPADMRIVVLQVRERFPRARLTMYGASAGSGQIAGYLADYGRDDPIIVAGVSESSGYDAIALYGGAIPAVYEWVMLRLLRRLVLAHRTVLELSINVDEVLRATSIAQFEERLYAKLYGFPSPQDYWTKNNAVGCRGNITIPLLCINSTDDPVCGEHLIPYQMFKEHESAMLVTTQHGGHCGFRYGLGTKSWAHSVGLQYLRAALDYLDQPQVPVNSSE